MVMITTNGYAEFMINSFSCVIQTSTFTIVEDEIKEEMVHEFGEKGRSGSSSSEVLKNLTTFKLTLEDDEKESKNRLHLPYFE